MQSDQSPPQTAFIIIIIIIFIILSERAKTSSQVFFDKLFFPFKQVLLFITFILCVNIVCKLNILWLDYVTFARTRGYIWITMSWFVTFPTLFLVFCSLSIRAEVTVINNKNNVFQIVNFVDIIHPEHQKDDERNNITRRLHLLVRVNRPSPTP